MCASASKNRSARKKSGQDRWVAAGATPAAVRNRMKTLDQVRTTEAAKKRWPRLTKLINPVHIINYIRHPSFGEAAMIRYTVRTRPGRPKKENPYFSRTGSAAEAKGKKRSGQDTSILGWHAPVFRKGWM